MYYLFIEEVFSFPTSLLPSIITQDKSQGFKIKRAAVDSFSPIPFSTTTSASPSRYQHTMKSLLYSAAAVVLRIRSSNTLPK